MQERQRLDDAIGAYRALRQDLDDTLELIQMGQEEDDQATVDEAEQAIIGLKAKAVKKPVSYTNQTLPTTPYV